MSNIKLIIVPAWLNLIVKELGITNDDLANYEKLSGILSPRDLLIYKIANFRTDEIVGKVLGENANEAREIVSNFWQALPVPTLEERALAGNPSVDTLIYGAASERMINQGLSVAVELTDTEVLAIRLIPTPQAADSLKSDTATLAQKIVRVMHGRVPLEQVAKLNAFKRYVNEIQINTNFY
jgi:hypothetical protein